MGQAFEQIGKQRPFGGKHLEIAESFWIAPNKNKFGFRIVIRGVSLSQFNYITYNYEEI